MCQIPVQNIFFSLKFFSINSNKLIHKRQTNSDHADPNDRSSKNKIQNKTVEMVNSLWRSHIFGLTTAEMLDGEVKHAIYRWK